ncbi:unnamed protein product [Candidula unifasciata]|uniref:Uncharacterized protein n=1 Tax=Candidula unifasciata TaxID=100452 RepID=A0A8S3ZAC2_9EUPU|nr:unnamed protein product [Candidula unifasciata]
MSKTFILKRNTSSEERSALPTAELRSRSLSRNGGYYYPYVKSDFGFDGSPLRCQTHDTPRNNLYYPATQENHSKEYADRKQNKRSSSQRYTSPDNYTVKRNRRTSPSPASKGDLRRKMVFVLHDEIKKSPCTTTLEEITDLDKITEMCMTTLRSMMEHKKYRKYLHHMNNNNSLPWYNYLLCIGSVGSFDSLLE